MVTTVSSHVDSKLTTKSYLNKVKLKAMRSGVWYKVLTRLDRVLIDLTIKVAETVHSLYLTKRISVVLNKLGGLLESKFNRLIRVIGQALAEKLSVTAQKLGNVSAKHWATDKSFALYLAVMHENN